ncbi:hypothetical protein D6D06_06102 [Aureobasidium pullulans]|nr:hypothetical protein D6D06_06102 [Aureobasidium pullulans]
MAQVKILKRAHNAVQCSSCKQRYDMIEPLDEHLETSSTGRRICPKTRAPALIVCVDCERDFTSVQQHEQHIQDSFSHNPGLSKPTGRSVYVGRLPANVTERDVVNILFEDFIVETTSMRTHCPHSDNFTFVNLTTPAEAYRATRELHNKHFLNQRVTVYLQRPKEANTSQPRGREARSRITSMSPSVFGVSPGKENIELQPPAMQQPQGKPVYVHSTLPPFDPRRPAFSFVSAPTIVHNQHYPPIPPIPYTDYRQPHPMPQFIQPQINHNLANHPPPGFVSGGFLSTTQPPATNTSQRVSRRQRARRQKFPPSYDGASDPRPDSSETVASIDTMITDMSAFTDGSHDSDIPSQQPSASSDFDSQHSVDQTWPALVSSDAVPEARAWTSFRDDELEDAYQALEKHCHDVDTLVSAGYNVTHPVMPPKSEIKAKVKCRSCRTSRQRLDRLIAESGKKGCSVARNGKHNFPGITHLTTRYEGFEHPPEHCPATSKRRAIALDCEMAGGWNGDGFVDQIIQLTAIDYLTGEVLISSLVKPTLDIQQWRTNIHGVSPRMMFQAIHEGTALTSVTHARDIMFSLMDKNTILVGHALNYDLNVLKIAHNRCVDSEILAKLAINRNRQGGTALKKVCESLMGLGVQRKATHSCLEDSFAAREAVIYMILHPTVLAEWAKAKQVIIDEEDAKRDAARKVKEEAKEEAKKKAAAEAGAQQEGEDAKAPAVLTLTMPALVPTPLDEIADELQMERGPSAGKKRKGGKWTVINSEE